MAVSSCIFDKYEDDGDAGADGIPEGKVQVYFRIKTLGETATPVKTASIEALKSLRVIIIDENGRLDINEKINLEPDESWANDFIYSYRRLLSTGKKKVFLVANEESVGRVALTDASGLPVGLPLSSLSDLLDHFSALSESETMGANFEKVLERVYFNNDFSNIKDGNYVYLPYSSCYEVDLQDPEINELSTPLYLVPVATKFDFTFVNYREKDAQIDDVIICNVNSHNFLNARLADNEKTRLLNEKPVWWIDWLEACAEASQSALDFDEFNKDWGWIEKYELPVAEATRPLSIKTTAELWQVPALVDKNNPSSLSVGPFYVPESMNIITQEEIDANPDLDLKEGSQYYTLSFKLRNVGAEEQSYQQGFHISTLGSLFRATHVMITVNFRETDVEIYSEMAPWLRRLFLGFVQQDDD